MKKIVLALVALFMVSAQAVMAAPDIRDLLGGLAGAAGSSSSSSSNDGSKSGSALGDALGGLISGLLGGGQLSEADLAGVYAYKEPAVTFKSDNLLQKAGGAAMAATIVNKLSPYYEKAGMRNLVVTLSPEKTFEFALGKVKLSGTFQRDSAQTSSNTFIFTFKALGKVGIGKITADVQRSTSGLIITFDASKLLSLMNSVAKLTGKQTLQAAAGFLNSYDGLNCGFSLTKTDDVAPAGGSQQASPATGNNQETSSDSTGSSTQTGGSLGSLLEMLKRK